MNSQSRRDFIKKVALLTATIPYLGYLSSATVAFGQVKEKTKAKDKEAKAAPLPDGQTAIPESDAVASAIGFHHNVKDIDFARYPERKKPAAKNDFCHNCALYTPVNDGWGKCQMLTSGLVNSMGWCGSYSKKA